MTAIALCAAAGAYLAWPVRRIQLSVRAAGVLAMLCLAIGWWPLAMILCAWMTIRARRRRHLLRNLESHEPLTISQCAQLTATMAVCGSAGVTTSAMWRIISESQNSAIANVGREVSLKLASGQDLASAYARVTEMHSPLKPALALHLAAHESGASIFGALTQLTSDMLARENDEVTARVRALGVKATLPLGGCFLPAFLLVAVVPMAASLL